MDNDINNDHYYLFASPMVRETRTMGVKKIKNVS